MSEPGICFRTVDNKYLSCPPRMSDGRHFTDYRPSCELNDLIRFDNSVSNSFHYRLFLKEKAEELMNKNREAACLMNCCGPCPTNEKFMNCPGAGAGTMLPEQTMWVTDGRMMKMVVNDPNGLGTGRPAWSAAQPCDDKLPKAWPVAGGKNNSCMTQIDRMFYLGDYSDANAVMGRVAQPRGGEVPAPVPPVYMGTPSDASAKAVALSK